ncbi:tripartite tricarboxylate transporter substrate binding protein [Tardiphaga alba]|uniref:tripartite tricarboxylate transporter substrate binding protein n=1 Tax=Tardiphaga alba TaxID=340268 RepID=UPI001BADF07C|nr:tripartite tricarboxylate transporter substrate binding protein [Tardiphaga alba]
MRQSAPKFVGALVTAWVACVSAAYAQTPWPSKPIRLVVPFPAGGFVDAVARQIQPQLQTALGQTVVIDNRGGAGGTLGASEVARSQPDGHTILLVFDSYALYPLTYLKLNFDVARDLVPVTQIASNPLILLTHAKVQAKDLETFVKLLKSEPGRVNYASVGVGSSNHLTAELFQSATATTMTHVPYRGGGPAQQDLVGGHIETMFLSASLALPHVKAGALNAIAQTGAKRSVALPDVPTVAERGYPGFEVNSWVGMLAPAGTPRDVIDRLHSEVRKILGDPKFAARLEEQGLVG